MIGIDILEIERIKNISKLDLFLEKNFNKSEIEYFSTFKQPFEHIAGHFCLKEAVIKALCTQDRINLLDIQVLHNGDIPYVKLSGKAQKICEEKNYKKIEVSISHSKTSAVAVCYIE